MCCTSKLNLYATNFFRIMFEATDPKCKLTKFKFNKLKEIDKSLLILRQRFNKSDPWLSVFFWA